MKPSKELREAKQAIAAGGGRERIDAQHQKNKLTARERLERLFDEGTFVETGMFRAHRCTDFGMAGAAAPADRVVTGYGRVDGRLVYAYAQDFTVRGGSLGEAHAEKIVKVQDAALQNGAPIVGADGFGRGPHPEGIHSLNGFGKIFYRNTIASGVVPQDQRDHGALRGRRGVQTRHH